MAGIACDTGVANVLLPIGIDMTRHLYHFARNDFGVLGIFRHILQIMAIRATLFG